MKRTRIKRLSPDEVKSVAWIIRSTEVMVRARWYCELATPRCATGRHDAEHVHHRKLRSQGGSDESVNLLAVCFNGHRYVHDHPAESYARGWLLRSWEAETPYSPSPPVAGLQDDPRGRRSDPA